MLEYVLLYFMLKASISINTHCSGCCFIDLSIFVDVQSFFLCLCMGVFFLSFIFDSHKT